MAPVVDQTPFFPGQLPGPEELPGQRQFTSACSACHGAAGAGNPEAGIPALNSTGDAWQLTAAQITAIILDGTATMPGSRGSLDRADTLEIIGFIKTLWTQEQLDAFLANE
jgi:mono/diheme cytochrome c family protein